MDTAGNHAAIGEAGEEGGKMSYTKGPWAIDSELPPNPRSVIARVGNIPISGNTVGPHPDCEDMPNARLIAAAPDLLEAAKQIIKHWERGNLSKPRQQLSEAIAKAEGEVTP